MIYALQGRWDRVCPFGIRKPKTPKAERRLDASKSTFILDEVEILSSHAYFWSGIDVHRLRFCRKDAICVGQNNVRARFGKSERASFSHAVVETNARNERRVRRAQSTV